MKKSLKIGLVITILALMAATSAGVYAQIFATSNTVHVDVQYNVALVQNTNGDQVSLTATVKNNGATVDGLNVDFYVSFDAGATWSNFASETTSNGGVATAIYTLTVNGAYDFKAVATVG